ncbi:patatin-like phospholipase family protein [Rhodobium orientis]|uniref:Patatin n=1 Tax=Rhodobium orientis TaxID=34017 RepID=A0A327JY99_9HYPH|nr:patatin-like phospholipase family protein [Rhodobium orientis]MBK5950681.1 patatin [Rhodobium orientis]RAI28058.1 patatin [Rhodobium orientis]
MTTPKVGLALGGGGARGMAHIAVIQAFDDLGIRPTAISGASIGAMIGAGYASGMTGAEIREFATDTFANRADVLGRLWKVRPKGLSELFGNRGIARFDAERVTQMFLPDTIAPTFEELQTPLTIVAADFYGWCEADISSGPLLPAVAASIAIPVIFKPVVLDGRIMVDGGVINPLPFDTLPKDVDIVVAVDVVGGPEPGDHGGLPNATESIFGATQLLMHSILREKLKLRRPDILVRPDINAFRVLDFLKTAEIMRATAPLRETLKRDLHRAIDAFEAGATLQKTLDPTEGERTEA